MPRPVFTAPLALPLSGSLMLIGAGAGNLKGVLKNSLTHSRDHFIPFVASLLAEQTHSRIPGRILTVFPPTPVGRQAEEGPYRPSQSTREVRRHAVHGDH